MPRGASGYHGAYLTLAAAAPGALCAMDGLLFVLFTSVAVVASALLVGGWGSSERRAAATKLALLGTIAVVLLLVAILAVSRHADPTFLVDGTKTTTTFSLPELSRVALGAKGAKLFGAALVKVAFVLVLLASLVLLGAFPLHAWLAPVFTEAPTRRARSSRRRSRRSACARCSASDARCCRRECDGRRVSSLRSAR